MSGITIIHNFITEDEEDELSSFIRNREWSAALKRRTQHYGYEYNYNSRSALTEAEAIPDLLIALGRKIPGNITWNQVIVNEYKPGQGIADHVDARIFGPVIAGVSLDSDIVMKIGGADYLLPRRSLLLLTGDARYKMKHGIAARTTDVIGSRVINRGTRISITFRTLG